MDKKLYKFFNNTNFIYIKKPISIKDIDVNEIETFNKFPFGKQ